jgi:hypothetical protein
MSSGASSNSTSLARFSAFLRAFRSLSFYRFFFAFHCGTAVASGVESLAKGGGLGPVGSFEAIVLEIVKE